MSTEGTTRAGLLYMLQHPAGSSRLQSELTVTTMAHYCHFFYIALIIGSAFLLAFLLDRDPTKHIIRQRWDN